jgi:hypothetical protein
VTVTAPKNSSRIAKTTFSRMTSIRSYTTGVNGGRSTAAATARLPTTASPLQTAIPRGARMPRPYINPVLGARSEGHR